MKNLYLILIAFLLTIACTTNNTDNENPTQSTPIKLTIFHINDQHGQIDNFSKIKHIVDTEKLETNVIVACSGDMFSGNPVVDNHPEKGFPMIDLMNKVGFDIAVLGNHEFDVGQENLKNRMEQADFEWVCANVDMETTGLPEPFEYKSLTIDDLKITFLGLVETNGKEDATIPSTHPWRVENFTFERPENVISKYADIKEQENSDLYIALSHLGYDKSYGIGDVQLAEQYPYFDLIIGGHSHSKINTTINDIPIFQAGSYLNYLGKIELTVKDKSIESIEYELIDLNAYSEYDQELKTIIDEYNNQAYLTDIIGFSHAYHDKSATGSFVSEALKEKLNVDITFQNTGGVRSSLNEGDITKREIYEILPFNNPAMIYEMTVLEIKNFLIGSQAGFYYSGVLIQQFDSEIIIKDLNYQIIPDNIILKVGLNDYIPAVYDSYFPAIGNIQSMTDAEVTISYLETINNQVNFAGTDKYFRYQ